MPVPPNWSQQLSEFVKKWKSITDWLERESELGDSPLEKFVLTEETTSWQQFLEWLNELKGFWCFRGQRESSWSLDTSLDRAVKVVHSNDYSSGYYHLDRETEQRELLFRFQQQAHHHIVHLPSINDLSSWLALMQHYGVPTRLLDWTKSPYVALYFALIDEPHETCSAVWAANLDWLEKKGQELLGSEVSTSAMDDVEARAIDLSGLLRKKEPVIVQIDPLRINERMVAQQGIFLCKLLHSWHFDRVLVHMMSRTDVPDQPVLRKLTVGKSLRIDFLKYLREMNIHSASLYPGLDGFGKSLKLDLEIKVKSEKPISHRT